MRMGLMAILAVTSLAACRRDGYQRTSGDVGEPQIVALSVRTQPDGATVKVNNLDRVWTTPCDIADFSIGRGMIDLVVSMEGYETLKTRVPYDGEHPATVKLKLRAAGAAKAVEPAPAVVAEPKRAPAVVEDPQAKPAPVKIEQVAGGTRVKVTSAGSKIRLQAKTVVSDPEKPGEYLLPDVPPDKVVVDLLDPKTDAVIASIEFTPRPAPVAVVNPPLPPPVKDPVAVPDADRVGQVKLVSKTFGVFVKLDPGLSLQPGEEILIFRDGKEVARTRILKITQADAAYPDGAAQVQKEGSIQKGDEVRRSKP
jgi:hypothetical protein